MNTFVLLGLVVLLVLFLLRSRRRGKDSGAGDRPATRGGRAFGRRRPDDPGLAPAAPAPAASPFDPAPFGSPFAAAPHAGAPVVDPRGPALAAAGPAAPPDPSDWAPADMIVEPGWPLPGEIAGTWSSGPETAPAPVATVETPLAETAATLSPAEPRAAEADEWEMPALDPVPPAGAVDESGQVAGEVPAWTPEPGPAAAADDVPMWMPEPESAPAADEAPAWVPDPGPVGGPVAEADLAWATGAPPPPDRAGDADPPLPTWTPDTAPAGDIWPTADPVEEPGAPVVAGPPAWEPPAAEAPPADGEPVEITVAEPAPAAAAVPPVAPEPAAAVEPIAPGPPAEPAPPVWDPAPVLADLPAVEPPAAPVAPAAAREAPADEIAALLGPALAAVRPLVRVSDHAGVTPRMLVVMRALEQQPLSVGEQAALLGVSRPVVADIATRLEGLGLTRRERDERDRRRVRMALTDRGRRVCAEAAETPSAEAVTAALAGLAGDDRAALLRGLRALAEAGPA